MDANRPSSLQRRCTMTIAEKTAKKQSQIVEICDWIREIFESQGSPLDLSTIEFHLKAKLKALGRDLDELDTFDVRDAIVRLVRRGEAQYSFGSEVCWTGSPSGRRRK
jgi:K+/H+ antiporter YhaU regulatory subunit KhtT